MIQTTVMIYWTIVRKMKLMTHMTLFTNISAVMPFITVMHSNLKTRCMEQQCFSNVHLYTNCVFSEKIVQFIRKELQLLSFQCIVEKVKKY